jgi:hypothetical protein
MLAVRLVVEVMLFTVPVCPSTSRALRNTQRQMQRRMSEAGGQDFVGEVNVCVCERIPGTWVQSSSTQHTQ